MRRTGWVLAALLVAGSVWWISSRPAEEPVVHGAAEASAPVAVSPPRSPEPPTQPSLPPATPEGATADTARAGHGRMARELGLVAIRCFVGSEYDADNYVGAFGQRVEDGWYSHVEVALEGRRPVEQRFEGPEGEAEFESRFIVTWSATQPGETVPCRVERMAFSTALLTVLGPEGEPREGVRVYGCGGHGVSDDAGEVEFPVHAGGACDLSATLHGAGLRAAVPVASIDEGVPLRMTIDLEPFDLLDAGDDVARSEPMSEPLSERPETAEEWEDEAALFDRWAEAACGSEQALYQRLADHRRRMAEFQRERASLHERMMAGEVSLEELKERLRIPK